MPRGAKKGERRGGRKKGTPNIKTAELRDLVTQLLDKEFGNIETMLKKIEKENGTKAKFECLIKLVDYALPKLKAIEFSAPEDQELKITIKKV